MRMRIGALAVLVLVLGACSAPPDTSASSTPVPPSTTVRPASTVSTVSTDKPSTTVDPTTPTTPTNPTKKAAPAKLVALTLPHWQIPVRPTDNLTSVRWHWTPDSMSVLSDQDGFVVTRSPDYQVVDTTTGKPAVYTDSTVDSSVGPATLRHTVNKAIWPGEMSPSAWWISWPIAGGQYVHVALSNSNGSKSTWDWRVAAVKAKPTALPRTLDLLRAPPGFRVIDESDEFLPGQSGVSPTVTLCPRTFTDVSTGRADPAHHGCIQVGAYRAGQDPFGRIPASQFSSSVVNGRQIRVDAANGRAVQLPSNGSIVVVADPSIGLTESDLAGMAASATAAPGFLASRGGSTPPPVVAGPAGEHGSPAISQGRQQVQFPVTPTFLPADLQMSFWEVRVDQFNVTYQAGNSGRIAEIGSQEPLVASPADTATSQDAAAPGSMAVPLPDPWKTRRVTLADGKVVFVSISSGTRQELDQMVAGIQDKPFDLPSATGVQQGVAGYDTLFGAGSAQISVRGGWMSMCPPGTVAYDELVYEVPQSAKCVSVQLTRHQDFGGNRNSSFGGSPPGSVVSIPRSDGATWYAVVDADAMVALVRIGKNLWLTLALPSSGGVSDVTKYLSILGTATLAGT